MSEKTISLTNLARYKQDSDNLYAKQNGSYENMSVGNADNLTPYGDNSGVNDTTAFVFQSSGGGSDIGSLAQLKELRGNTVKLNQLVTLGIGSATVDGVTFTRTEEGIIQCSGTASADISWNFNSSTYRRKLLASHKYLAKGVPSGSTEDTYFAYIDYFGYVYGDGKISTLSGDDDTGPDWKINIKSGTNMDGVTFYPQFFDLTEMFGAGNEPASVLEFNRLFPKIYYGGTAGTLLSCKSSGYKTVGYNQFDGEWENGFINTSTGQNQGTSATSSRTKNYIRVVQGQTYKIETSFTISGDTLQPRSYFYDIDKNFIKVGSFTSGYELSIPDNCCYVRFAFGNYSVSSTDTLCLHLKWDGSKTGYEPYKSQTFQLPNVELRSAGSVYDIITPNGTLTRRVGIVDLGSLEWGREAVGTNDYRYSASITNSVQSDTTNGVKSICSKYNALAQGGTSNPSSNGYTITSNNVVVIHDTSNNNLSTDDFRTAMSGVYLIYELATPTTEQVSTFVENTSIDDWGTQEFISSESIVVPQSCDFFYVVDYKAFIDSLGEREDINYDASKIVSSTELQTAMSGIDLSGYGSLSGNNTWTGANTFSITDDNNKQNLILKNLTNSASSYNMQVSNYNNLHIIYNNSKVFDIYNTSGGKLYGEWQINGKFTPASNGSYDLGASNVKWKDLYLSGSVIGANNVFNVINATDIVNNTLTQAQYDLITNGKPTLIIGGLFSMPNILLVSFSEGSSFVNFIYFADEQGIIQVNKTSKVISKESATYQGLNLRSIRNLNGKALPAYPSSTGTFVLKCVNGTLTWVAE